MTLPIPRSNPCFECHLILSSPFLCITSASQAAPRYPPADLFAIRKSLFVKFIFGQKVNNNWNQLFKPSSKESWNLILQESFSEDECQWCPKHCSSSKTGCFQFCTYHRSIISQYHFHVDGMQTFFQMILGHTDCGMDLSQAKFGAEADFEVCSPIANTRMYFLDSIFSPNSFWHWNTKCWALSETCFCEFECRAEPFHRRVNGHSRVSNKIVSLGRLSSIA